MFYKSNIDKILLLDNVFYQDNIVEKEKLKNDIDSYVYLNNNDLRLLRFGGYAFSDDLFAQKYYEDVLMYYKNANKYIPLPRGNLSKFNNYIFVGIKPGSYNLNMDFCGTAWLFGPSSKILNKFLIQLNIYPYFTNIFKSYFDNENEIIGTKSIINEIRIITDLYEKYNKIEVKIVLMGNYTDYDIIRNEFKDLKFKNIWHPSYIIRNNETNFSKWIEQWNDY